MTAWGAPSLLEITLLPRDQNARAIDFIERNRDGFSFSAYTEYLLRESMRNMRSRELRAEDEVGAEPRRAIIRAR